MQFPLYQPEPSARPTPYGRPAAYDQPHFTPPPSSPAPLRAYPPPPQFDPRTAQHLQPGPGWHVVYQPIIQPVVAAKSAGIAYVLWFFLGFFGVHHFYLGRVGQGITYLLLTVLLGWLGLGVIVVGVALLVDLFLIPTYTRDANQRIIGYRF
ncbi:NINE protein [Micropruina sp.]|uniref:TM2 domain-containing protein n=1 Tax=Micropruina sp. TaxID=2737536 RepID=UPI0039E60A0D